MTAQPPTTPEPRPEPRAAQRTNEAFSDHVGPPDHPVGPDGAVTLSTPRRPRLWLTRGDVRGGLLVAGVLTLAGLPVGVIWYLVAPRLGFRVDASGNLLPVGPSESEALIGADGWFTLLTAAAGLLAGVAAWWWRSVRGPIVAAGLAAGGLLGALLASWVGHLLGHGPSAAELHQVDRLIHAPLHLRATVALVVEPFVAVFGYVVGASFAGEDDLGRPSA